MDGAIQEDAGAAAGALKSIEKYAPAVDPASDPMGFVVALGRAWKERGGRVDGKRRHSDRRLVELLKKQGAVVRSLTPKLAGKTKLKPDDARALIRLFLSHWDYVRESSGGNGLPLTEGGVYRALLSDAEIEDVSRYIVGRMSQRETNGGDGTDLIASPFTLGDDTSQLVAAEFQESDALFIISSERTLIVPDPNLALIPFRDLLTKLFTIDTNDNGERILVWVLDLGALDFEDSEARLKFLNVENLISRFTALRIFKEQVAEDRWSWLQSRTMVMLHNAHGVGQRTAGLAGASPHFLFDSVPFGWAKSPKFRSIYGDGFERLDELNYTVFLTRSAEDATDNRTSGREYGLRYFAHAFMEDHREVRGLELPSPGRRYEVVFETVYKAAACGLGRKRNLTHTTIDDCKGAVETLRRAGFSLFRLEEFINLWSRCLSSPSIG
jgi:hypothetical protein